MRIASPNVVSQGRRSVNLETKRTLIRVGALVAFALVVLWVLRTLESVTTMLMVSFLLAYLIDPVVRRLESLGLRRSVAVGSLLLCTGLAFVVFLLFVVPVMVEEIVGLVQKAPRYWTVVQNSIMSALQALHVEPPKNWGDATALIAAKWQQLAPGVSKIADSIGAAALKVFSSTLGLVTIVIHLILIPVLVYYFSMSFDQIKNSVVDLIPSYLRGEIVEKLQRIDRALAGFVRGQLVICTILAALYSIGFLLVGIDVPIFLGVSSGYLFMIPYVGTVVALVGGAFLAFVKHGDLAHPLFVVAWISVVQLLESYVLTPRIVGEAVGLHPLTYILALIIGAQLFGFVGLLLAIPSAAALKVLIETAIQIYKRSDIYRDRKLDEA